VDNIRMDLQEVGCGYMDWIGLAQDRDRWWTLVSAVMNLRVPQNVGNFLTSCKPVSFSRRALHHGVSTVLHNMHIAGGEVSADTAPALSETTVLLNVSLKSMKCVFSFFLSFFLPPPLFSPPWKKNNASGFKAGKDNLTQLLGSNVTVLQLMLLLSFLNTISSERNFKIKSTSDMGIK